MDSRRHVQLDPGVASGCNEHIEYPLVPKPTFVPPLSDEQKHPSPWRRIFLPSRIVRSIDDRIKNHDLRVAPTTCASDSSLATKGEEADDEPADSAHSASSEDGGAYAVVAAEMDVDVVVDDDDIHGDCSTVPVLHENRNAHPDNSFVRVGKLVVVDRSIPIDLVADDDAGWEV
jgi:hypothetical protein